jgi:hypothetical protein
MPEDVPFTIDESNNAYLAVANYVDNSWSYVLPAPKFQAIFTDSHSFFIRGFRVAHELLRVRPDSHGRSCRLNSSCHAK